MQQGITFLSIFEICYRALGRGDAVGAGRKLPAHSRVPSLTNAACSPSPCCYKKRGSAGGMVYVYCGGRGNLRAAKTPPLQSALRGDHWGDYRTDHHLCPTDFNGKAWRRITTWHAASLQTPPAPTMPMRTSTEAAWRQTTTRRVASLRPSRNGRIGFKPPYSKRGIVAKGLYGFHPLLVMGPAYKMV